MTIKILIVNNFKIFENFLMYMMYIHYIFDNL